MVPIFPLCMEAEVGDRKIPFGIKKYRQKGHRTVSRWGEGSVPCMRALSHSPEEKEERDNFVQGVHLHELWFNSCAKPGASALYESTSATKWISPPGPAPAFIVADCLFRS